MRECRYKGNCCVMYHRPFDSDELPCDGYDEDICSLYEPMPDVKALKGLADEMETAAARYENRPAYIDDCAYRIREALGVES